MNMVSFGMPTLIELPELESCAALCRELGLEFVEINMSFTQYQPEVLDEGRLRDIMERYGVYFTIHADESTDPCSVNSRIAEVYTENMELTVKLAGRLGIPTVNLHLMRGIYVTLPTGRTFIYAENEELYLEKLRAFRERMEKASAGSGVRICIENTDGFELPFLTHGVDTLLESPAFSLTYDIGHDHAIGERDKPFILRRADRLSHMHMHDGAGEKVHLALGDGELDIAYFRELADEHDCRIVLETKTVEALRSSVKYLRDGGMM